MGWGAGSLRKVTQLPEGRTTPIFHYSRQREEQGPAWGEGGPGLGGGEGGGRCWETAPPPRPLGLHCSALYAVHAAAPRKKGAGGQHTADRQLKRDPRAPGGADEADLGGAKGTRQVTRPGDTFKNEARQDLAPGWIWRAWGGLFLKPGPTGPSPDPPSSCLTSHLPASLRLGAVICKMALKTPPAWKREQPGNARVRPLS